MYFIVDAQLPPALARVIAKHGHAADHVFDIGPNSMSDSEIWDYAVSHNGVIVTKDEDFGDMVAICSDAPAIVWVRVGNLSRSELITFFAFKGVGLF